MLTGRETIHAILRFARCERGATAIEYGLIAFATATVLFVVLPELSGSSLWGVFDVLSSAMEDLTSQ